MKNKLVFCMLACVVCLCSANNGFAAEADVVYVSKPEDFISICGDKEYSGVICLQADIILDESCEVCSNAEYITKVVKIDENTTHYYSEIDLTNYTPRKITIDLNGHNLVLGTECTLQINADTTLVNTKGIGEITLDNGTIENRDCLTINGANIFGMSRDESAIMNQIYATLTVNSGLIAVVDSGSNVSVISNKGGNCVINGGKLSATSEKSLSAIIFNDISWENFSISIETPYGQALTTGTRFVKGNLEINGGDISIQTNNAALINAAIICGEGSVKVTWGEISAVGERSYGIFYAESPPILIGGIIRGETEALVSGILSTNGYIYEITNNACYVSDKSMLIPVEEGVRELHIVNGFEDITAHWAKGDILWAYENGYINGTSQKIFEPDAPMTRAMLVTILYRIAGEPTSASTNPFTDVPSGEWYTNAVNWAVVNGIVSGYGDGIFGTNDAVSRQDLATILMRYARLTGIELPEIRASSEFGDSNIIADYAKNDVNALYKAGVINGKANNLFDPFGTATRAEVAAVLHRFL